MLKCYTHVICDKLPAKDGVPSMYRLNLSKVFDVLKSQMKLKDRLPQSMVDHCVSKSLGKGMIQTSISISKESFNEGIEYLMLQCLNTNLPPDIGKAFLLDQNQHFQKFLEDKAKIAEHAAKQKEKATAATSQKRQQSQKSTSLTKKSKPTKGQPTIASFFVKKVTQ